MSCSEWVWCVIFFGGAAHIPLSSIGLSGIYFSSLIECTFLRLRLLDLLDGFRRAVHGCQASDQNGVELWPLFFCQSSNQWINESIDRTTVQCRLSGTRELFFPAENWAVASTSAVIYSSHLCFRHLVHYFMSGVVLPEKKRTGSKIQVKQSINQSITLLSVGWAMWYSVFLWRIASWRWNFIHLTNLLELYYQLYEV